MARWKPLQERLVGVEERLTVPWADLDDLVGGLPPSALAYPAFWGGERPQWAGFRTTNVRRGCEVTFVRQSETAKSESRPVSSRQSGRSDLVLIGCVKSKLGYPAPAKDLYTSALFRKERAYAESSGKPWFILSAKHGLVSPDEVIEPYDVYLKTMPDAYRAWWGRAVVSQLGEAFGPVDGVSIEIHASAAYVDQILPRLTIEGARVVTPLHGLTMGQRLAWYGGADTGDPDDDDDDAPAPVRSVPSAPALRDVIERLGRSDGAMSPQEFVSTGGMGLRHPGMYSWWVDHAGAATLSAGLDHQIVPGLIYAGLAGATHTRLGKKSSNTLWGRIRTMHLGGRHEFSTFRHSLGSILAKEFLWTGIDEAALTAWMYEHLRVVAVPVADADSLDDLETTVLAQLDPPLNLMKMSKTPVRKRLSDLRRQYGRARGG
jgi:hypothetical protein